MKTCSLKSVYEAIVLLRGIDPATAGLSATQKAIIAGYINERLRAAWERAWWPEIMLAEQRWYRAIWDDTLNYTKDDEVYHEAANGDKHYYRSLKDGNIGKDPDVETTWWEEMDDDFVRTLDFQQQGETEIGAVDLSNCVFYYDPRVYRFAGRVTDVMAYGNGILVNANAAPAQPWIWFRPPPPEISLTEWSASTDYAIGDLCYLAATGESYKALQASTNKDPESETTYWRPVEFPDFLKVAVRYGAHAEWLLDPVEQAKAEARWERELESLEDRLVDAAQARRKVVFGR